MKRIIYIDYIWRKGHVNFNQIHINALRNAGFDVKLVLYKSMQEALPFSDEEYAYIIPDFFRMKEGRPLLNRIGFLIVQLLIRLKCKIRSYDEVLVANFDEITMGLLPITSSRMYLIAHTNAEGLSMPVKRFFLKKLSKRNVFVVFNRYQEEEFHKFVGYSTRIVSHGCTSILMDKQATQKSAIINTSQYSFVLFHASSNLNRSFIKNIIENREVISFLQHENALIILRNAPYDKKKSSHIVSINGYLTKKEYTTLMKNSDGVILAYPSTFKYRVSGVSYECVAMQKNMLVYDNAALQYCRDYYSYDPMFYDAKSFISLTKKLIHDHECKCIVSAESLAPNYDFLNE